MGNTHHVVVQTITSNLIEALLNDTEGNRLDFKSEQYDIEGDSGKDRIEFVKDVLAFANAWRTEDAYILVGVEERSGRSEPKGVVKHHNESNFQQLVNKKTNRPIVFDYTPIDIEGVSIGAIRIPVQERPFYLKKQFGHLKANTVYLRRGSSTDEASADEIAKMGEARATQAIAPSVELFMEGPATSEYGAGIVLTSIVLEDPLPDPPMDPELERLTDEITGRATAAALIGKLTWDPPRRRGPDAEELRTYRKECALLNRVCFVVTNRGGTPLNDAVVSATVQSQTDLTIRAELPEKPRSPWESEAIFLASRIAPHDPMQTTVNETDDGWRIDCSLGKIRPGESLAGECFFIGASSEMEVALKARVLDDNLPKPVEFDQVVAIKTEPKYFPPGAEERDPRDVWSSD